MTADEAIAGLGGDWAYHERRCRLTADGMHPALAAVLAADSRLSAERREQREAA